MSKAPILDTDRGVVVTGATGLVGSAIRAGLAEAGYTPWALSRRSPAPGSGDRQWDPAQGRLDPAALAGASVVIHLAGENIAAGRWTATRRQAIRDSRVRSTRLLATRIAALPKPPALLISASAIGYYGSTGEAAVTEADAAGTGFLAEVCEAWEAELKPAVEAGVRVVPIRLGMVLSGRGGALAAMLPLFRWGLGGRVGSGRQWMSWISLTDVARAVLHVLQRDDLAGPINVVSPRPVRNRDFVRTLARVLRRPAVLPAPALALRLALGAMADELLLASQRVLPARLQGSDFAFTHADLEAALRHELRR